MGSGSRTVAEAEIGTPQVSQNYCLKKKKKKTTILINMNLFNILLELFALDLEFLFKLLDQIIYTLIEKGSHVQSNACVDCSSPNIRCWYIFLNSFNLQSYFFWTKDWDDDVLYVYMFILVDVDKEEHVPTPWYCTYGCH